MQDAAANHSSYSCFKEEEHQNPTCLNHHHDPQQLRGEDHERDNSPSENGGDSPPSTTFGASSSSSPKRGRKGIQKRVVTVPIKDVEGLRLKGESTTPPSDSWAWRKYGQKPIKGSPFPRGYYRCSSSKGCPARKQVERSCTSPCTLVITYSHEHNHSRPASRNHHHHHHQHSTTTTKTSSTTPTTTPPPTPNITNTTGVLNTHPENNDIKPMISSATDFGDESLVTTADFTWFSDVESTMSSTLPDRSSILSKTTTAAVDYDMITRLYPMREEDESLFADLGELPECSKMFGRGRPITAGVVQGGRRPSTVVCKQLYNLV